MGRVHANTYANAARLFPELKTSVSIRWVVGNDETNMREIAELTGAECFGIDWRDAVNDREVDLVDICLPDNLHYAVAKAALQAGKHVYCEKPFTDTFSEANELAALAREKGAVTRVGHNFPINPVHRLAREVIKSGEIGNVTLFKGCQHVDYLADPEAPFIWRADGERARTGIVGDTGSHVFSFADYLIGEVEEVMAHCPVVIAERPDGPDARLGYKATHGVAKRTKPVTNPDAGLVLCRFRSGALGAMDFSRIAMGRRFQQRYEVYGTKGALVYDYEQITRLNLFKADDAAGKQGFRAIDIGSEHFDYVRFLPLANLGLGYNEVKAIEIGQVIASVAHQKPAWPTFEDAKRIVAMVEACMASTASRQWERVKQ